MGGYDLLNGFSRFSFEGLVDYLRSFSIHACSDSPINPFDTRLCPPKSIGFLDLTAASVSFPSRELPSF